MGNWNSIQHEIKSLNRPESCDIVRRQKIDAVQRLTGRHLVIYAVDFTNPIKAQLANNMMLISLPDKDGFDEVTRSLPLNSKLDILLHSPGGSAEATESIVEILRARFSDIRFIIPNTAKSAATMMAMSGEQLLMDECSELGPTDPQMILVRDGQALAVPAQAIKDQFKAAQEEVNSDPSKLPAWVPILREYGPSLLAQCDNHLALARELVSKWLKSYMFANDSNAELKAEHVAKYLADHNNFRSHSRRVGIADLQALGVDVLDMRTDSALHAAIRDLYTAIMLTFSNTAAYKIFENSNRDALIGQVQLNVPQTSQERSPEQSEQNPQIALPRNRQEEKRQQIATSRKRK
jgi:hypothetical protein